MDDAITTLLGLSVPTWSLQLLDTSGRLVSGAAPHALNSPQLLFMQHLKGLNHAHPLSCLFVQLCPSVQWELKEFQPQHPFPPHCVRNNGPSQWVLNPLPAGLGTTGCQGEYWQVLCTCVLGWYPARAWDSGTNTLRAAPTLSPMLCAWIQPGLIQPSPAASSSTPGVISRGKR